MCYRCGARGPPSPPSLGGVHPGSEINFVLGRRHLVTVIYLFSVTRWKMWSPNNVNKIFPSERNTSTRSFSRCFFARKYFTPERSQESDSTYKGIKYCVAYNLLKWSQIDSPLSLETERNTFFLYAVSTKLSRSKQRCCSKAKHVFLSCAHGIADSSNR